MKVSFTCHFDKMFFDLTDQTTLQQLADLWDKALAKHGGYATVTIELPKRPRSTGYRSQNSHVQGHCESIAEQLGYEQTQVYDAIKRMAVGTFGYPTHMNEMDGVEEPKPQRFATVEEANLLIKMCHHFADAHNFWLIEIEDKNPVKMLHGKRINKE